MIPSSSAKAHVHKVAQCSIGCNDKIIENDLNSELEHHTVQYTAV